MVAFHYTAPLLARPKQNPASQGGSGRISRANLRLHRRRRRWGNVRGRCVGVSCAGESSLPSWLPGAGSRVDILRFSPEEIQARLPECLKALREAIGAHGGLA